MDGHTTWALRDIAYLAVIIFNSGGLVYLFLNHVKHSGKNFENIFDRLSVLEKSVAWIKGKLNDK